MVRKLALISAVLLAQTIAALEVDLEWETGLGAKHITTAMSLLRFANDTAPALTEWIPLGWAFGSLSLQRLSDTSQIVLQIAPPTPNHQVILGRLGHESEALSHATTLGPTQVLIQHKVDMDGSQPYYFKLEAHHDMVENRTTYEGLYSVGNEWVYLGSLVLQHPKNEDAVKEIVGSAIKSAGLATKETPTAMSQPPASSLQAEGPGVSSKERKKKDEDEDDDSDKDEDDDTDKDSDTDSDSDTDDDKPKKKHHDKEMFAAEPTHHHNGFMDFIHTGLRALHNRASAASSGSADSGSDSDSDSDSESAAKPAPAVVNSTAEFPDFPVFPRIYSGLRRPDNNNITTAELRAGVFKKFVLRDRLGQTFFISRGKAFMYDGSDDDVAEVRHYFAASSYLITLDGPRVANDGSQ
ncbi:hypothetical protein GGI25_003553 [Coemansia spiralis]|uniref:Uncharacterized protein n=2 Tax=Coemansia TaxID=4863 RepID=A0A9W8KWG5_9FUNG|nr:hypothetical protein BX070DRAFT_226642 [Coemansia spiralis]KAJ1990443.1 hypothetical protein EDC05_004087 [Coemansia umbellata]KAJ2622070.1 hypothetical protein GGI26_003512 [Coemansia sp. RSA 1358]KAJ2676518.1 hypothetical protein GGI25_003553 [Coemansia spiralis]